uniref:Vitellogenin domain-containing protein n=1 Tax=Strigamia maritima TaxID=126957 RepID=T1IHA0_STRMM
MPSTIIHNRTLALKRVKSIDESARTSLSNFNWETEQPYSNLTESLINIRNPDSLNQPIIFEELCDDCDSLKEQTRHVFRQYIEHIKKQHMSIEDSKQILDQIPLIQRGLISLDYSELKELAREFSNDRLTKETFFQYVALTATNPCIKLIMESCTNKMITPENCAKHLSTIAAHVANPNTLLADKMLEFCMSSEVQNHEQMSVTCYMTFGSIVAQAVAKGPYQIPKTNEKLFSTEKRQHYVRALEKQLENTDDDLQQAALLMALGNCALEEALPVIERYIRANENIPKVVQLRAIYSMIPLCRLYPELVREPLISVLFNAGENTEARIAAFNVLVISRPRRHLYEKIAAMTQYGEDTVLNVYIYSSFASLANATQPCLADAASHAQNAVDLIDDEYDTSAWIASTTVIEGPMEHLDADAFLRMSSVGDAGSMTPSLLYLQLKNLVSNYATNIFSVAMYGNNTSYLVETLIGAQAIFEDRSLYDSIHALNKPLKSLGLKDLAEQVGYVPRKQPEFSALVSARFMDFQQRLARLDKETLLRVLRAAGLEGKGQNENMHFNVDVQSTRMPVDAKLYMHLDCGHVFVLFAQTPIHMSLKGEIRINPQTHRSRA